MSGVRRIEVKIEPPPTRPPPGSMDEAVERERALLEENNRLYPMRRLRPADYQRAVEALREVREWIKDARRSAAGQAPDPERRGARQGTARALHDVAAFGLAVLDEIDDEGCLTPLGARFQAEVLELLPEGYYERWRREALPHKASAVDEDEDDEPPVPGDEPPPDEPAVARCFARLRARCRRVHAASAEPGARRGSFCACGLPHGGGAPPACGALGALGAADDPGSPAWLAAARSLDASIAAAENRPSRATMLSAAPSPAISSAQETPHAQRPRRP